MVAPSPKESRLLLPWSGVYPGAEDGAGSPASRPSDHLALCLSHCFRYNVEVKHIKIMTAEGLYRITEKKAFRGLVVRATLPLTPASQGLPPRVLGSNWPHTQSPNDQ